MYIFFFSSRRRHTRLQGDWSSDVCSSDLEADAHLALERPVDDARQDDDTAVGVEPRVEHQRLRGPLRIPRRRGHLPHHRSEERRVGEEGRSRWAPYHLKKKKK